MIATDMNSAASSSTARSDLSSPHLSLSMDCSPFLNWDESRPETDDERAIVFRSLVATVNAYPPFDDSLEAKAVKYLECVTLQEYESHDDFLNSFGQATDESLTNFVQSIVVLISCASPVITPAAMKTINSLIWRCSEKIQLSLAKADLVPQIINTLDPLSLSFAEAVDIHGYLMNIIFRSLWLSTPISLEYLELEVGDRQQAVHETVLKQVFTHSEQYLCHLCANRFSIIDRSLSTDFMGFIARLLEKCSSYQPTMDFVLRMPVALTIPSDLAFFENDEAIWYFLVTMNDAQQEWNKKRGEVRQMWKTVQRVLRMEGIENVIEEKLLNDQNGIYGKYIVGNSIEWNNLQDMNITQRR